MSEAEKGSLTPEDVKTVQADTAGAFQDAAAKFDASAPLPPPPAEGPAAIAEKPGVLADEIASMDAEDAENLLALSELLLDDKKTALKKGSLVWALDEKERKKLAKPASRVAAKWLPGLIRSYPDETALAIALALVYAGRVKEAREHRELLREQRAAAETQKPAEKPAP